MKPKPVRKAVPRAHSGERIHLLAEAVENCSELIALADLEGHCIYANRAFLQALGYSKEEVIGKHMESFQSANNPPALNQEIGKKGIEDGGWRGECLHSRRDGSDLPVLLSVGPTKDKQGRVIGGFGIARDISERKRAEESLRRSEEQFRELAENIREVFFTCALEPFRVTYISPAHEEIWGRPRQEVYDRASAWIDSIHPEDRERAIRTFEQAQRGAVTEIQYRIVRPDGSVRWVSNRTSPVHDSEGRFCRVVGFAEDITARKKTEDVLKQSEAKFKTLFETANDAILIVSGDKFSDCNLRAETLFRCRKEDIIGHSPLDFSPSAQPDGQLSSEKVAEKIQVALTGVPQFFEWKHVRQDGTPFDVEVSLNRVITPDAEYLQAIVRDITERKRMEAALKQSEEKYRLLVESIPSVVWSTDQEGKTHFISPNIEKISGYTLDEIYAAGARLRHENIHPEDAEKVTKAYQDLFRTHSFDMEYRIRRKDGRWVWVRDRAVSVFEKDGVKYAYGVFSDITERKQAESSLQEAHAKLRIALEGAEQHAREAIKLTELVDILQSCQTVEEACQITRDTLPATLSSPSGALCLTSPSRNLVEVVATWGDTFATEKIFAPDNCWALRRGKIHRVDDAASPLRCAHVSGSPVSSYVCVPLAAHGETLGVLCLERPSPTPNPSLGLPEDPMEVLARQASAVGERISLALANLRLREVLRSQSIRDPLTGLFNRRYMEESLERELRRAARNGESVALLMLDIDRFKQFNDTFGHQAGDTLLRGLGDLLSQRTRGQDVGCRYGGEEFVLILAGATADAACKRGELLRQELKQWTMQHAGQVLGAITVSIGISAFPGNGVTAEELLRSADRALYRAKTEGRDRVVVASPAG